MGLMACIAKDAVCPDLQANERDDALGEILRSLISNGHLAEKDFEPAMKTLLEREKLGSTAIGKGIAVPHGKIQSSKKMIVTFGRSAEGVRFKSLDGEVVKAIFLVISPVERPPEYLEVMESISRVLQNPDFKRFVLDAADVAEILEIIEEMS